MEKLQVKYAALDKFKVNERNPRVHSEDQLVMLAEGIKKFGFNVPVAIDKGWVLIYGHARLAAAAMAGLTEIPFVRLEHLNDEEKLAFMISDNRLAEGAAWNWDLLVKEISELDFDPEPMGFTPEEFDALVANIAPDVESLTVEILDEQALWPKIEIKVPQEVKISWDKMLNELHGAEWQKIAQLVERHAPS